MNYSELTDKYKILIFDFDETLVRLNEDWRGQVAHLKTLYPEVVKAYPETVGRSDVNYIVVRNSIVEYYGDSILPEIRKITEKLETENIISIDYNQELIDFAKLQCGNKPMYIWSGNCTKVIESVLNDLGIYNCFSKIVTQDTVKFLKPNPEGFSQIYRMGDLKSDYVLIGDSDNDMKAAKDVGIDFLRIDYFDNR